MVELLVNNQTDLSQDIIDDYSIGAFMQKHNINIINTIPRRNDELKDYDDLDQIEAKVALLKNTDSYHFRLKSGHNKSMDPYKMSILYKHFYKT